MIEKYGAELIADKGGDDSVTAAERRLIELSQTARACAMLILAVGHEKGLIREVNGGGWDLQPGFKELNRYLQTERQALQALGLERRQKIRTLAELFAEETGAGEMITRPMVPSPPNPTRTGRRTGALEAAEHNEPGDSKET